MEKEKDQSNKLEESKPLTYFNNDNVYTDIDRQLFNVSLSSYQFLKEARKDEVSCMKARRKCRSLLESGRTLEARVAAKTALEARGRAYAYSAVSKRIEWLLKKLNEEGCMKREVQTALEMLDSAVLANDVWQAKRVTNIILTEIEKMEAPDIPENPTEKEVTQYLKQLKEEIAILNRLRMGDSSGLEISGDFSSKTDLGYSSDASSIVSSASKMINGVERKPKRFRKMLRVTERSLYE